MRAYDGLVRTRYYGWVRVRSGTDCAAWLRDRMGCDLRDLGYLQRRRVHMCVLRSVIS